MDFSQWWILKILEIFWFENYFKNQVTRKPVLNKNFEYIENFNFDTESNKGVRLNRESKIGLKFSKNEGFLEWGETICENQWHSLYQTKYLRNHTLWFSSKTRQKFSIFSWINKAMLIIVEFNLKQTVRKCQNSSLR